MIISRLGRSLALPEFRLLNPEETYVRLYSLAVWLSIHVTPHTLAVGGRMLYDVET